MKAIEDLMNFKKHLSDHGVKMPEGMAMSEDKMNTLYCDIICKFYPTTYISDRIDVRLSVCNEFCQTMGLPKILLLE